MAKFQGATYFTVKGGLNTETNPLSMSPSDATDLANVDINIDGSVQRRKAYNLISPFEGINPWVNGSVSYGNVGDSVEMAQFSPVGTDGLQTRYVAYSFSNKARFIKADSALDLADPSTYEFETTLGDYSYKYNTHILTDGNRAYITNRDTVTKFILCDDGVFSEDTTVIQERIDDDVAETSTLTDITDKGFSAACMSNSRLWVANCAGKPNTLWYSQTIINGDEWSKMYQVADPYDETDNLIVDTDGGSIKISGANQILALAPLGSGVIVLADNGVWSITGQDGFRATNYSINKISSSGIVGSKAWATVEQQLVYFGSTDIHTVLLGTAIDTPEVQGIGNKILSFYNSIPIYQKKASKVIYDPVDKKLYFFCDLTGKSFYSAMNPYDSRMMSRDALVMDVRLASWTKYTLAEDSDGDMLNIATAAVMDIGKDSEEAVTDGGVVVTDDADPVTSAAISESRATTAPYFIFIKKDSTYGWKIAFGKFDDNTKQDFSLSEDDVETNTSFITIAPQVFKDVGHRKFAHYLIPIFERVESGVLDEDGVDITPGGCNYRINWNWSTNNKSTKFGELRAAYLPYRWTIGMFDGDDQGIGIVTSRIKMRGSGNVYQIHFESDGDKDFKLYGWQIMVSGKERY